MSLPRMPFSQRIRRRLDVWWGRPRRWADWRTYRDGAHRIRERMTYHEVIDPLPTWRCCEHWQRVVNNKWNAHVFAELHGCRVPRIYWFSRSRAPLPDPLPDRYVIRPVYGTSRIGIYVVDQGRDQLRGIAVAPGDLPRLTQPRRDFWPPTPVMLEEMIPGENGGLPLEIKCHTIANAVVAIETLERTGVKGLALRVYDPDWQPFDDAFDLAGPQGPVRPAPPFLSEMIALASRMGAALGTYSRIDFFAGPDGPVFNEFSGTPDLGQRFTPFANEYLAEMWDRHAPGTV